MIGKLLLFVKKVALVLQLGKIPVLRDLLQKLANRSRRTKPGFQWLSWAIGKVKGEFSYDQPDINLAIAFIERQPKGRNSFSRQPFDQLISRLKSSGHEMTPRRIEYLKQEGLRREIGPHFPLGLPSNPMRWAWLTVLRFISGHNLYVSRTLGWASAVLVFSLWVFSSAYSLNMIKEVDSSVMAHDSRKMAPTKQGKAAFPQYENIETAPQYPRFSAIFYTVDVFVPLVDLYQERYWIPSVSPTLKGCIELQTPGTKLSDGYIDCNTSLPNLVTRIINKADGSDNFTDTNKMLRHAYAWSCEFFIIRHIMWVRHALPLIGWILVSIIIAVLATKFRDVATMSRNP